MSWYNTVTGYELRVTSAWGGLLDARGGQRAAAAAAIDDSLAQARALGRVGLEARIRELRAQVF